MTNADMKKMINYYYQLSTFALTMQDEMKELQSPEWEKIACDLLTVSQEMNKFITTQVVGKLCP